MPKVSDEGAFPRLAQGDIDGTELIPLVTDPDGTPGNATVTALDFILAMSAFFPNLAIVPTGTPTTLLGIEDGDVVQQSVAGVRALDLQEFDNATTAVQQWEKPTVGTMVHVVAYAGGGSGESGAKGAAGGARRAGGSGQAGGRLERWFPLAMMDDTETITFNIVGRAPGGASVSANSTVNNPGGSGSNITITIGSRTLFVGGGGGGGLNAISGPSPGAGGNNLVLNGPTGVASSATGAAGTAGTAKSLIMDDSPSSGGSGGGVTAANAGTAGGLGGPSVADSEGGGAAHGADGVDLSAFGFGGLGGGGGNGASAGAAEAGGDGGNWGGGGGGGGAATNDSGNSGAGGDGGLAHVVIEVY